MALRDEQPLLVAPNWMESDTEESIVGTEWHQEAIGALALMLEDVAERRGATWGVCEQIELSGLRRRDGRRYHPKPDVMVLAQPFDGRRSSISLTEAGVPLFIAEVASTSTVRNDREGKREVYAAIGVPEYLIFDPAGDVLGRAIEAWRLGRASSRSYVPWEADADGYWRSRALGVALRPEGPFLAVRDRDGATIPHPRLAARLAREEQAARRAEQAARREAEERLREEQAARRALEEELERLRALYEKRNQ